MQGNIWFQLLLLLSIAKSPDNLHKHLGPCRVIHQMHNNKDVKPGKLIYIKLQKFLRGKS